MVSKRVTLTDSIFTFTHLPALGCYSVSGRAACRKGGTKNAMYKRTDYRITEEGKRRFDNPEIYEKTLKFQTEMGKLGVAWHNHFANECTADFCCCEGDNMDDTSYKHYVPSFRTAIKVALDELYEKVKHLDNQGQIKRNFDRFAYEYE
jgi:hypothetical protein